jgi:hypothetical protein
MGDAESRVRISTSEECSVRREGEEYYALTSRATGGNEPCPDQASTSLAGGLLSSGGRPSTRATGKDDAG